WPFMNSVLAFGYEDAPSYAILATTKQAKTQVDEIYGHPVWPSSSDLLGRGRFRGDANSARTWRGAGFFLCPDHRHGADRIAAAGEPSAACTQRGHVAAGGGDRPVQPGRNLAALPRLCDRHASAGVAHRLGVWRGQRPAGATGRRTPGAA